MFVIRQPYLFCEPCLGEIQPEKFGEIASSYSAQISEQTLPSSTNHQQNTKNLGHSRGSTVTFAPCSYMESLLYFPCLCPLFRLVEMPV